LQNSSDMNTLYKLNQFQIYKNDKSTVLMMNGIFISTRGTLRLLVSVNGDTQDSRALILPQEVVKGPIRHSFDIILDGLPKDINSFELILKEDEEHKTVLFSADENEIKENTIDSSIVYSILGLSYSKNGVGTLLGWAYSTLGSELTYAVLDENGKEVPTSLRRTVQQRLREREIVDVGHSMCGFIISFPGTKDHSYQLKVSDGNKQICIPLNKYIVKENHQAVGFRRLLQMNKYSIIRRAIVYLKKYGFIKFLKRIALGVEEETDYNAWFQRNRVTAYELGKQSEQKFAYALKISIIVPTFNTPANLLREMIESVVQQSYSNWELCIADGSDEDSEARSIILDYQKKDPRIKVTLLKDNYGISGNTNHALEMAEGEYTALFDHDDVLELNALYEIVKSLQDIKYDIIYTDEDKLDDDTHLFKDPNFKPDYDKDLFLTHNYITHFFVVKTDIIKSVGGFDSKYDGAQDYDVMLKCIEKTHLIHHIAKSLYHWRMHEGSTALDPESKMYCYVAGQNAVHDHLERTGIHTKVEMLPKPLFGMYHVIYEEPKSLVSIIIPNLDHVEILRTCIQSLFNVNSYQKFEVVIVENNSKKKETFDYYKELQAKHSNVKVVAWEGKEFNYSALNNFGAKYAKGDYFLFLNNDTEMMKADALREMVSLCARDDVGVVGAKLLYADNTIQHAGVVIGFSGYAGHVNNGLVNGKEFGYMVRDMANMDMSAVTGACMMTKKSVYEAVNGFDEQFKVACNDIDYCMKVTKMGKLVVYNAFSLWHHYESKSRGYENGFDKIARFDEEVDRWQKKWMDQLLLGDPYYNQNFRIEDGPFILR